jgi:hypothetical protein
MAMRRRTLLGAAALAAAPDPMPARAQAALPPAETIPLWRWGTSYPNFDRWAALGISGSFVGALRDPPDANQVASVRRMLDAAQRAGHAFGLYLHPLNSARWGALGSADPSSPQVRDHAMATLNAWMSAVGDHPALRHMLLNSEYPPRWQGQANALTATMAKAAKAQRPDLITWTDPWRDAPLPVPAGVDVLGSWTYGHPHPLRQTIVPFLRAGAGADRAVMQTVSLYLPTRWSAAAEEAGAWRIAPPAPAATALWLAFAQAPEFLSIYAPSTADPFSSEPARRDISGPETWAALGQVHANAIAPFGPVLRACRPITARTALVLAAGAVAALPAASLTVGWHAEQAWPWAAMLAQAGIEFRVLLDSDLARPGALDAFETVLVPFVTGLPESTRAVLAATIAAKKRVVTGAAFPGARVFAADFAWLRQVDGGLATPLPQARARQRLNEATQRLLRVLEPSARDARHNPDVFVAQHDGGAVRWAVLVNLALESSAGANGTYADRGQARRQQVFLPSPQGAVWVEAPRRAVLRAAVLANEADLLLDLPEAGGTVLARLPGPPTAPRLERSGTGAVLRAPFPGVLPYDVTLGATTRRHATARDGTLALPAARGLVATCALSGKRAVLDI